MGRSNIILKAMHLGNIEDWGKRIKRNIVNKKERERGRKHHCKIVV